MFLIAIIIDEEDAISDEAVATLPDTSAASAGLGLVTALFGFMMLFATKKKNSI